MVEETDLPPIDFKSLVTKAVIDNTAFAGLMRLYAPELREHQEFNQRWPSHRQIDERSLLDILTAIVLYDWLLLERSSKREGNDKTPKDVMERDSWVEQMKNLLRPKESCIFWELDSWKRDKNFEDEACRCAFNLLASAGSTTPRLDPGIDKIPDVYRAKDYAFRPKFDELNKRGALDEERLVQAMFLHRGLFLQAFAHSEKAVYLPYHSRGKLLAAVPPMTWAHIELDGFLRGNNSLARDQRPLPKDVQRQLNEIYYKLLYAVSWREYDLDIPFVGAAIWDQAAGSCKKALELALKMREKGNIRTLIVNRLQSRADAGDRSAYERELRNFRTELQKAAEDCGVEIEGSRTFVQGKALWKLLLATVKSVPGLGGVGDAAEAIEAIVPKGFKDRARQIGAKLIDPTPMQMLFLDHAQLPKLQ
jgi:hypothetical protein